jgi:hypothetical protein
MVGMSKPILLDLFCRMGGATVGYQRAGFHVIGVDIEPQSGYPGDQFIQSDAIEILKRLTRTNGWLNSSEYARPALIHASPPCQEGNTATISNRTRGIVDSHQQLVPPTCALLDRIGIPYVIEQPASSRAGLIRKDLVLCMDQFKGTMPPPWVQKHRAFEISGFTVEQPKHESHTGRVRGWRHGVKYDGPYVAGYGKGGGKATAEELRHAMGIDWMTERFDLCEAIPPAYSEWIGRSFLGTLS